MLNNLATCQCIYKRKQQQQQQKSDVAPHIRK